jgi:GDPmannose 4,6-dehydratase
MPKTAFITGITGQDGSYLAEFLLSKGYQVHGLVRRASCDSYERIRHLVDRLALHSGDLLDWGALTCVLDAVRPDEIYNLGAQSFVPASWKQPLFTGDTTGLGATRLLEAMRTVVPRARFYQASSSEMFGKVLESPQRETTPFYPRSPYAAAKAYAHFVTVNYRESYNLFACCGILFNHESPRRGKEFVTRKITNGVARIRLGMDHELRLGNLAARRDWGFAGDYVRAMWLMLQQDEPDDYVIGTGETHTVEEFVRIAFERAGLGWQDHVRVDPEFFRPAEVDLLLADPTKARDKLGWQPEVRFHELVGMMVDADLEALSDKRAVALPKAA